MIEIMLAVAAALAWVTVWELWREERFDRHARDAINLTKR